MSASVLSGQLTLRMRLFLRIARMNIKGEIDKNFYLIVGFFALLLVYAITLVITKLKNKKSGGRP